MVTRWDLFEDAEAVLERRLRNNPDYPFQILCSDENGRTIYFHSRRTPYFYFSIVGCVVSAVWLVLWVATGGDTVRGEWQQLAGRPGCLRLDTD